MSLYLGVLVNLGIIFQFSSFGVWSRINTSTKAFFIVIIQCSLSIISLKCQESVCKGSEMCHICRRKQGVCIKVRIHLALYMWVKASFGELVIDNFFCEQCNYGHCQSSFHPLCARSAGFQMNLKTSGGKLQHKAYCERYIMVERAKVNLTF